ncbi:hypothetical protein BDY21DRAFT_185324 [Lineolata rhizophorae]|uniref:Uncharacterized protein n=1 Tax=Lineolata rhizophorae TaxID=578093 RepID=A0A6A6P854_9PEZI|nr:hypothetical protein BDY21DRAFT_185324 [Lineolata rhizophorae]
MYVPGRLSVMCSASSTGPDIVTGNPLAVPCRKIRLPPALLGRPGGHWACVRSFVGTWPAQLFLGDVVCFCSTSGASAAVPPAAAVAPPSSAPRSFDRTRARARFAFLTFSSFPFFLRHPFLSCSFLWACTHTPPALRPPLVFIYPTQRFQRPLCGLPMQMPT